MKVRGTVCRTHHSGTSCNSFLWILVTSNKLRLFRQRKLLVILYLYFFPAVIGAHLPAPEVIATGSELLLSHTVHPQSLGVTLPKKILDQILLPVCLSYFGYHARLIDCGGIGSRLAFLPGRRAGTKVSCFPQRK